MKCDSQFVRDFFLELEKENIRYCILRNADEVEAGDAHDIDMTVELKSMKKAFQIMQRVAKSSGWKMHMMTGNIKDKVNIKCMNFFKVIDGIPILVHFDFFPTSTWNGMLMLDNESLLEDIDCSSVYHRANPGVEAVTKLFIRLLHNNYIKEKYIPFIYETYKSERDRVMNVMGEFLSFEMSEWIYNAVYDQQWEEIVAHRTRIVSDIIHKLKRKKNYYPVKVNYYLYLIRKLICKAGPMVVFEGTDGSGKTTVISGLPIVMERTFNENLIDYYHWRPNFIKSPNPKSNENTGKVCTEPHAKKPYNKVVSIGKFFYFNLDYILGYFLKTRIQQGKGRMVIFDRYYYDYYLDKLRYRLNISDHILNTCLMFIPRPDVTIILSGNAEIIYERKKELSVSEIQDQIDKIELNSDRFAKAHIIDTCQPIEQVIHNTAIAILEENARKFTSI